MVETPRPSPTIENYLGIIYTLDRDGEAVIGRKLADWLQVSAPTVTATVRRMIRDGWVTMDRDKTIHLTQAGHEAAQSVIRRHMLTELLLARVLGVPWSRVHDEADRLEHGFSADTTARVEDMITDTTVCPHGNPLPGHEYTTDDLIPLLEAQPGTAYQLARVHEEIERHHDLMRFLEKNGLVPGAHLTVVDVAPYNETLSVCVQAQTVVLGLSTADKLWVRPITDSASEVQKA